jgi:alkylhydroperoxidase family enzyme
MSERGRSWPFPDRVLGWIGAATAERRTELPGPGGLPAYARARWPRPDAEALAPRIRFLVAQLAAVRSTCGYCATYNRHLALRAGIAPAALDAVADYPMSPLFTEPERAALALADALTEYCEADGGLPVEILVRARCHLREEQIMALVAIVATEHFFDPGTGGLGRDALAHQT